MGARVAAVAVVCMLLGGCRSLQDSQFVTGVHPDEVAEIRAAIGSITSSPVRSWSRSHRDPTDELLVWTVDGKSYRAKKVRGKWHFKEVVIFVQLANHLTRRCS